MGFEQLLGQKRAVETIKTAVKTGRISHAYLFHGPDGVGKNLAALIFAKLLNCAEYPQEEPCEKCKSCRLIAAGNHPDVIRIAPKQASLKIQQIRDLHEKAYLKCYEGRFKVIIIDDINLMTIEAANSLLKILEEPPGGTVFILLAEDTTTLPLTLLSRSQCVLFNPLEDEVIRMLLQQKNIATSLPVSLAHGSAGKMLELAADRDTKSFLEEVNRLMNDLKKGGYKEIFEWSEAYEKDKKTAEMLLDFMALMYHRELVQLVTDGENDPEYDENPVRLENTKGCFAALEEIQKAFSYLKSNANTRLVLDNFFIRLRNIIKAEGGNIPIG